MSSKSQESRMPTLSGSAKVLGSLVVLGMSVSAAFYVYNKYVSASPKVNSSKNQVNESNEESDE